MLVEVGITSASTLRSLGPAVCYRRLRFHHGRRVTTNFIYALECACRGIGWRDLAADRKAAAGGGPAINAELTGQRARVPGASPPGEASRSSRAGRRRKFSDGA